MVVYDDSIQLKSTFKYKHQCWPIIFLEICNLEEFRSKLEIQFTTFIYYKNINIL